MQPAACRLRNGILYLQRIAAMLTMRGHGHFSDSDVADVAKLALCGLMQRATVVSLWGRQ
jgi:hypothetical protein